MSSTDNALNTAVGSARFDGDVVWVTVDLAIVADELSIRSRTQGDLAANGDHSWALEQITAVEEVVAQEHDQFIDISFDTGDRISLSAPRHFVSHLVARLESVQRRVAAVAGLSEVSTTPRTGDSSSLAGTVSVSPTRSVEPLIDLRDSGLATSPVPTVATGSPTPPPIPSHWNAPPVVSGSSVAPPKVAATYTMRPVRSRRAVALGVACALLVVALAAATLIFRSRSVASEELAATRAHQLTETNADLKETKAALEKASADLATTSTERDSLKLRVSEVTNEKAQVQDERNAAQEVARLGAIAAQKMLDCRNRIIDAMSSLLDGYLGSTSAQLDSAVPVCQEANSAVAEFSDATKT